MKVASDPNRRTRAVASRLSDDGLGGRAGQRRPKSFGAIDQGLRNVDAFIELERSLGIE